MPRSVNQFEEVKIAVYSRVRVGSVTLIRVSNGTIETVTVRNQEQTDKNDHTVNRAELAVDGFNTSHTGRCENVSVSGV